MDVTGMVIELARRRRDELDKELVRTKEEMKVCVAERKKATLTVLETQQAVERLAARARTGDERRSGKG